MARNDTDFIYVPVPRARVYEVMDLLRDDQDSHHTASPEQDPRSIASTGSEPRTAGDEAPDRWTADSLRRLIADTPPLKQRVVLQCLAENAGQPVSAAQLRTALTDSGAVT